MTDDLKSASERKLSFFQTAGAVLWSFVGLRRGSGYREDAARLNPIHVIVVGLLMAAAFVVTLILIVRAVVS